MWNFAKKLALAGVSTLLVATASLSAAYNDYYDNNFCCNNASNDFCCGDWSFEAEFLYWRSYVDELPVGRSFSSTVNAPTTVAIPGDGTITVINGSNQSYFTKYLDPKWRPGARLTLGYQNPGSCWDWKFAWTWLHSKAKASLTDDALLDSETIEAAWASGATPPFAVAGTPPGPILGSEISGNWGLSYNTFEIGVGYSFGACCDQFHVRPHFDIKVASLRQKATFSTTTAFTGFPVTTPVVGFAPFELIDQVQLTRDYVGVGPQIGIDLHYTLCGGFGVYAKAAAALLYAEPQIKFSGKLKTESPIAALNFDNNESSRSRSDPRHLNLNTTLGLGLEYSRWICDCSYRVFFKLGWEHQLYTNQNQFHRAVLAPGAVAGLSDILFPVENGDLSLYGLTASIGLDY